MVAGDVIYMLLLAINLLQCPQNVEIYNHSLNSLAIPLSFSPYDNDQPQTVKTVTHYDNDIPHGIQHSEYKFMSHIIISSFSATPGLRHPPILANYLGSPPTLSTRFHIVF